METIRVAQESSLNRLHRNCTLQQNCPSLFVCVLFLFCQKTFTVLYMVAVYCYINYGFRVWTATWVGVGCREKSDRLDQLARKAKKALLASRGLLYVIYS